MLTLAIHVDQVLHSQRKSRARPLVGVATRNGLYPAPRWCGLRLSTAPCIVKNWQRKNSRTRAASQPRSFESTSKHQCSMAPAHHLGCRTVHLGATLETWRTYTHDLFARRIEPRRRTCMRAQTPVARNARKRYYYTARCPKAAHVRRDIGQYSTVHGSCGCQSDDRSTEQVLAAARRARPRQELHRVRKRGWKEDARRFPEHSKRGGRVDDHDKVPAYRECAQ